MSTPGLNEAKLLRRGMDPTESDCEYRWRDVHGRICVSAFDVLHYLALPHQNFATDS